MDIKRALIVYGSSLGYTKLLAERVEQDLRLRGWDTVLRSAEDVTMEDFLSFDLLLIGSSTWTGGNVQEEMQPLYEALEKVYLGGVRAAVFGVGDREGYPEFFCKAVDSLEARLESRGAFLVQGGLRQDEAAPLNMWEIDRWCAGLAA